MTPGVQCRKMLIIVLSCSGLVRIQVRTGWLKDTQILVSRSAETAYYPDSGPL